MKLIIYYEAYFPQTQYQEYKEGSMLTGEVKQQLIVVLSDLVARHQIARAQVTEEVHENNRCFLSIMLLNWGLACLVSCFCRAHTNKLFN